MVIGIFGESCTGKSTLAARLKAMLNAEVYSGKDYLRLAKSESAAKLSFQEILNKAADSENNIIYVISEREHMKLLPASAIRVLVTADLELIKARFAERMHGTLPAPVAAMLEKKHGGFDEEAHDIAVISGQTDLEDVCTRVQQMVQVS